MHRKFDVEVAPSSACSCDLLFAYGKRFDTRHVNREPNSGSFGRFDHAARTDFNRWFDDVFFPVTRAGRNVSRQSETGKRRHRDVVRAPDSRLEHAATPNRNLLLARYLLDSLRLRMAADATELDVDDLARS